MNVFLICAEVADGAAYDATVFLGASGGACDGASLVSVIGAGGGGVGGGGADGVGDAGGAVAGSTF